MQAAIPSRCSSTPRREQIHHDRQFRRPPPQLSAPRPGLEGGIARMRRTGKGAPFLGSRVGVCNSETWQWQGAAMHVNTGAGVAVSRGRGGGSGGNA